MPETITTRVCTRRVTKQTKVYDTRCSGFYVSITPKGVATFSFKYWNAKADKQASITIGVYDPERLTAEMARTKAFELKAKVGRGEQLTVAPSQIVAPDKGALPEGSTVDKVIDDFLREISTLVVKADGEKRPRLESWENIEGFLNRNVRPEIGKMVAAQVTNNDIARVQKKVAERSTSSARQTRSAMSRLFKFAAEAGRPYGVTSSPVHNLPGLDKEYERTRVLNPDEIRTLWWGLDDPGVPCIRPVALALKFELVTMLRGAEIRTARRSNIAGLGTATPYLRVPLRFVKKRRVIQQPLNSLAVEIVNEALLHNYDVISRRPCSIPTPCWTAALSITL